MLEALEKTMGVVAPACRKVGVTRQTFYNYMKDEEFAQAYQEVYESSKDFAESTLLKAMQGEDRKAIDAAEKYLNAHAKERGYGKHNHTHDFQGKNVEIRIEGEDE